MITKLEGHGIVECKRCGVIIAQCRCMDCGKLTVYSVCDKCSGKEPIMKIRLIGSYKAMSCLNQPTTAEIELSMESLQEQLRIKGLECANCISEITLRSKKE